MSGKDAPYYVDGVGWVWVPREDVERADAESAAVWEEIGKRLQSAEGGERE